MQKAMLFILRGLMSIQYSKYHILATTTWILKLLIIRLALIKKQLLSAMDGIMWMITARSLVKVLCSWLNSQLTAVFLI